MRRPSAGAQQAVARREREDAAKRLHDVVPELTELKLHIEERREGAPEPDVSHTRHIVIGRAPALFEVGCSDRKCDGNHDLTKLVMKALRQHEEEFDGRDSCDGNCADGTCGLELVFHAEAKFAALAAD